MAGVTNAQMAQYIANFQEQVYCDRSKAAAKAPWAHTYIEGPCIKIDRYKSQEEADAAMTARAA